MYKGFKVIDADAHISEIHDIWSQYMEPEYYARRPIVGPKEESRHGASRSFMECEIFPEGRRAKTSLQGAGEVRKAAVNLDDFMPIKYGQSYALEFTPESRIADLDRLGWDKQVLIDNAPLPLRVNEGRDQGLLWACARAYNNYSRDFADTAPSRLKMVGVLPHQHDIEGMVIETRRVIEKLGAVTVTMPKATKARPWHDLAYDPFWNLAEELDFPISFHGVGSGDPHTGSRYQPRNKVSGAEVALDHAIGFPFENMISLGHLIFLGVLGRHPKLRVSFLEGNAGWLPFWLGRLDDHGIRSRRQGMWYDMDPLPLKPSDYFKRQGFVACDPDEFHLKGVVDALGDDNIVWNTDYSHPDAPDPDKALPDFIAQPISKDAKRKILWDNAVRLYGERILE
ncbi:MAG: amidohydrolase [SAR202 cluster bacterium]|nr:amidohydrolase [SAR202 cluster bacterium]